MQEGSSRRFSRRCPPTPTAAERQPLQLLTISPDHALWQLIPSERVIVVPSQDDLGTPAPATAGAGAELLITALRNSPTPAAFALQALPGVSSAEVSGDSDAGMRPENKRLISTPSPGTDHNVRKKRSDVVVGKGGQRGIADYSAAEHPDPHSLAPTLDNVADSGNRTQDFQEPPLKLSSIASASGSRVEDAPDGQGGEQKGPLDGPEI